MAPSESYKAFTVIALLSIPLIILRPRNNSISPLILHRGLLGEEPMMKPRYVTLDHELAKELMEDEPRYALRDVLFVTCAGDFPSPFAMPWSSSCG